MFSLLAFKALEKAPSGELISPVQKMRWQRKHIAILGSETYYLYSHDEALENGVGIFAATYEEAKKYGENIYLVAPDPNFPVIEAESGWRAVAAFVVGGPYDETSITEAAEIIYAANRSGYNQVRDILLWSAMIKHDAEIIIDSGDIRLLYKAIRYWPDKVFPELLDAFLSSESSLLYLCDLGMTLKDDLWNQAITEKLVASKNYASLYSAALNWPDKRFDPAIVEALIEVSTPLELYLVGLHLPQKRWNPAIAQKLIKWNNAKYLLDAARTWPDDRFNPAIVDALIKTKNIRYLVYSGISLPDTRWNPEITKVIIDSGNAKMLLYAAAHWPDRRASKEIIKAFIAKANADLLYRSGFSLPIERWDPGITEALIASGNIRYICYAACNWSNEKFSTSLVNALIESGNAEYLCFAGEKLSSRRWNPQIARALADTKDEKSINKALQRWTKERKEQIYVYLTNI